MQTSIRDGDPSQSSELAQPLVLVAEEDQRLALFLERALVADGYRVERARNGARALEMFNQVAPDVVLLNLGLPGIDGLELARHLRGRTDAPIVMLSGLDSLKDRIAGLDAGGDDYLSIPFAVEELLARLRAVRRGRALASACAVARASKGKLLYADVCLDLDAREAFRGERPLDVRNKGLELLAYFMRHPERVLTRRELLEDVWGFNFLGDSNVIEVTVSHIRQALEAGGEPRLIHTVRPIGYILNARDGRTSSTL